MSAVCVFCVSFTTDRRGSERNEIAAKTEKYHRVLPSFIIPFRAHGRVMSFAQVLVRPVAPVMTRYDQRAELARFTRGGSGGSFSRRSRPAAPRRNVPQLLLTFDESVQTWPRSLGPPNMSPWRFRPELLHVFTRSSVHELQA